MQCANCSNEIPDGSAFCMRCGVDVSDPTNPSTGTLDDAGFRHLERTIKRVTAGEYEIEGEIGRGGMGVVYLATETQLARKVALKVLPPLLLTYGEGAVKRFQREARTAAALDHPNIIPIYRVSSGGELMWYSMKLLEGRSLAVILEEEKTLSFSDALQILKPVAEALDFAHARKVIHRDIKPGNIMICDDARVVVTDFGIAKELQAGSLTASGSVLGTPHYMSPEQYLGTKITGAADQYSLAVVTYQMLAGRVPFEASSAYELLNKHVSAPPPELKELRPGLPVHAYLAVERALAKNPNERFPSVREFVEALENPALTRTRAVPPKRRRRAVAVAGTIGVIAAATVGIGTMIVNSGNGEEQGTAFGEVDSAAIAFNATVDDTTGSLARAPDTVEPAATEVVATAPAQSPSPAEHATAPEFGVLILTLSDWANIFIDGSPSRPARVHRDTLSVGTHLIRLERDGYVPVDTSVVIVPGQTITFSLPMRERQ